MDEKKLVVMEHLLLGLLEEAGKTGINLTNVRSRAEKSLQKAGFDKELQRLAAEAIKNVPR